MIVTAIISSSIILFFYMCLWFSIAQLKKDNSIVDIAWGFGFLIIAWFTFLIYSSYEYRQILTTLLVTTWAIRLSIYIIIRNSKKSEDIRYQQMRIKWGKQQAFYSFLYIFMLQGLLILIISYPIIFINYFPSKGLQFFDYVGLLVWFSGFLLETIADAQLYVFLQKKQNAGVVFTGGLWRYSRHPNYFAECLIWWSIWLIALSVPLGWTSLISPIIISYLLYFVSGVPLSEKQMEKLNGFEKYKKQTSKFFPWFISKKENT